MQTIKIETASCKASFTSIEPILGDIRVQGWISAPSRAEGFAFSGYLAEKMGRKFIGGFCLEDQGPVHFPFSFDVRPEWISKFSRYEYIKELHARVTKMIRRAQRAVALETKAWKRIPSAPGYENVPTYLKD
jgi:hypothetical protein